MDRVMVWAGLGLCFMGLVPLGVLVTVVGAVWAGCRG